MYVLAAVAEDATVEGNGFTLFVVFQESHRDCSEGMTVRVDRITGCDQ
jgi:hypothetical protein